MNYLLNSKVSRHRSSVASKLKLLCRHQCLSRLKRKTNCDPSLSVLILLAIAWIFLCLIISFLALCGNALRRWQPAPWATEYHPDIYQKYNGQQQIINTNIAIVIPSFFNEYTLSYLDRILHNIYLSQIDFKPDTNHTIEPINSIYFPAQLIISMSIKPEYYKHVNNMTRLCDYYINTFLDKNSNRLQLFLHRNKTLNAAQNRNYGLSKVDYNGLNVEYVGFFDIDDVMHPQRLGILYNVLNANKNNIDFIFHAFVMNRYCKEKNIFYDYLPDFNVAFVENEAYFNGKNMELIANDIENRDVFEKDYCVAYYQKPEFSDIGSEMETVTIEPQEQQQIIFKIECNNERKKRQLIRNKHEYLEIFKFDRYYHSLMESVTFINYSQLIHLRCEHLKYVPHPINGEFYEVSCDYGTMAGGLERFRNQKAFTRHHNGWPTMKASIAKQLKYDENWNLHGSYRGQDSGFNTEAYHKDANIFHTGYYLGMYCYG